MTKLKLFPLRRAILAALWCAMGSWRLVLFPLTMEKTVTTQTCLTSIQTYQSFFPGSEIFSRKRPVKWNKVANCF